MSQAIDQQLVADIGRDVVMVAAPEELPLFRVTAEAYFADPERLRNPPGNRGEMLAFEPFSATLTLLTPIVLAVVTHVVQQFAQDAMVSGIRLTREWLNGLFGRSASTGPEQPPKLSRDAIEWIRRESRTRAAALGLPADQAALLADALAGALHRPM
jgi:hypothetical protein